MPLFESLKERKKLRNRTNRRRFLFTASAGIGLYFAHRWWKFRAKPLLQRKTSYIIKNREFFNIAINPAFRPDTDLSTYQLKIEGPDSYSRPFSYSELRSLPSKKIYRTLMCVGNPVGGKGIGNAEWTVTRLNSIISEAVENSGKYRPDDLEVCFYSLDGFYSSVPFRIATDPETYLAFEMNGAKLPKKHGFPVRVLIPNKYGMKQPRWLERIVVGTSLPSGYWERRGWSSNCAIKMTSRIDSAKYESEGIWIVKGIAFCGGSAVGGVELSDGGPTWSEAQLEETARPGAWSTWSYQWRPEKKGDHVLTVRTYDSQGRRQTEDYSGSFRSGSTGLHRVTVTI